MSALWSLLICVKKNGDLWKQVEARRPTSKLAETRGNSWKRAETIGDLGKNVQIFGNAWQLVERCEKIWIRVESHEEVLKSEGKCQSAKTHGDR